MPFRNFLKTKRKLRMMDASSFQTASKGTNVENSEILSKPFPPLSSRAKSPTALLDVVGHPRLTNRSTPDLTAASATTIAADKNSQQQSSSSVVIKPRRASVHSITPVKADLKSKNLPQLQQVRIPSPASPLPLIMPVPKKSVPPTRRMLQRSEWGEKTELPSAPGEQQVAVAIDPAPSTSHDLSYTPSEPTSHAVLLEDASNDSNHDESIVSKLSQLDELYQQLQMYKQEQEVWARREDEHRQREQWMKAKLEETQLQLQQLWTERQQRDQDASLQHSPPQQYHHRVSEMIYYSEDEVSTGSMSEDNDDEEDIRDDGAPYYSHLWESSYCRPPPPRYRQHGLRRTGSAVGSMSLSRKSMQIPRSYYYDDQDDYYSDSVEDDDEEEEESFGYSSDEDRPEEMLKHPHDYHGRRWIVRVPSRSGRHSHHQAMRMYRHPPPLHYMPLEFHQHSEMLPPPPHMIPNRGHMRSRQSFDAARRRSRASSDPNLTSYTSNQRTRPAHVDRRYTPHMHPWMASSHVLH